MKKQLLIICMTLLSMNAGAQSSQLYGTTLNGGTANGGTIYKIKGSGQGFASVYSFSNFNIPAADLVKAADGKLYGTYITGGATGDGVLFSFNPANNTYTKLYDFTASTGSLPYGILMQAGNGKLYGMAAGGGALGAGVIYSFNPVTNTYADLAEFNTANGFSPVGGLIQATDGKLYGMTGSGGANGAGTLISFNIADNSITDLFDFDYTNGATPNGSLVRGTDSKLYGMTLYGGINFAGNIFSYDILLNQVIDLFDFDYIVGGNPSGSLIQATNGLLYGMTEFGGLSGAGNIFSFDPSSAIAADIFDFDYSNGGLPVSSLKQAADRMLYGMTTQEGASGAGVLFRCDLTGNNYSDLFDFGGTTGSNPNGGVVQTADGKLYGIAAAGGANNYGSIFSFNLTGNIYTDLYDVAANKGCHPQDNVVQAADGNLYGLTNSGGAHNYGVLFKFNPRTNTYSDLFDFNGSNGSNPFGQLIQARDGKLYGMTNQGGSNGLGVLFSFNPANNTYKDLFDFDGISGALPFVSNLIQANNSKLYGMTFAGGAYFGGVIFSYDPARNVYAKLYDFSSETGVNPKASLMKSSNGRIVYGTTFFGGANDGGVIFSFDITTNTYYDIYEFDGTTGSHPHCTLVQGGTGGKLLYGLAQNGGANFAGALFSFNPGTSAYSDIYDFDNIHGTNPLGSLTLASDMMIYGTCTTGGGSDDGVIFKYNPVTKVLNSFFNFNGANGINPRDLIEYINQNAQRESDLSTDAGTNDQGFSFALYPNPSSGMFNIHHVTGLEQGQLYIYNMMGMVVYSEPFIGSEKSINAVLSPGIYFVAIKNDAGQYMQKLIIQ